MSILAFAIYALFAIGFYTVLRQFMAMLSVDKPTATETIVIGLISIWWPITMLMLVLITVPAILTIMIWSAYQRYSEKE